MLDLIIIEDKKPTHTRKVCSRKFSERGCNCPRLGEVSLAFPILGDGFHFNSFLFEQSFIPAFNISASFVTCEYCPSLRFFIRSRVCNSEFSIFYYSILRLKRRVKGNAQSLTNQILIQYERT